MGGRYYALSSLLDSYPSAPYDMAETNSEIDNWRRAMLLDFFKNASTLSQEDILVLAQMATWEFTGNLIRDQ